MSSIDIIKKTRKVSAEAREKAKEFAWFKNKILSALDTSKAIPEIAKEIKLPEDKVTFYLMTLLKYGKVEVVELDDADEYFSYKRK